MPLGMVCFCDKIQNQQRNNALYPQLQFGDGKFINSQLISKSIPDHKTIKVTLSGSYDFMGDVWAGAYAHVRGIKA